MSYDVQILVNGSRCKQYFHNGKIFIEAKQGSEYAIEIKNNTWQRILAVCSVDGLDILSGKPAKEDAPGYVISGFNTGRFDGFRVSNEKVAKFLFDYKGSSYAASKEDGSEKNVGVVGIRLFQEKVKPPVVVKEVHHHHDHYHDNWWNHPWYGTTATPQPNSPTIWCDGLLRESDSVSGSSGATMDRWDWMEKEWERGPSDPTTYCCDNVPTKGGQTYGATLGDKFTKLAGTKTHSSAGGQSDGVIRTCSTSGETLSRGLCGTPDPIGFDMGTKWGEAKESRVIEVEFEKGILALTTSIFYASRQSLIEMGVPIGNEKQVSFPEPFQNSKYATPPKGWNG